MNRWIVYQRERFPLIAHAPLVAAFSASAVCFSTLLRGRHTAPSLTALVVAFVTSLLFFLQLRIADEIKDFADDARWRPYRPVPRGLVTLRELGCIAVAAAAIQLGLALAVDPALAWLLLPTWGYLALMTREFCAPRWLRAHPLVYVASHMTIIPLIDLYATACDWRIAGMSAPPPGLAWFLAVSYLNGVVIEIGRKTRARVDEEQGVETYSALWGPPGAAGAWLLAIVVTGTVALQASRQIGTAAPTMLLLGLLIAASVVVARRYVGSGVRGSGRSIEAMAGVWTVVMYLGLGAAPLVSSVWGGAR